MIAESEATKRLAEKQMEFVDAGLDQARTMRDTADVLERCPDDDDPGFRTLAEGGITPASQREKAEQAETQLRFVSETYLFADAARAESASFITDLRRRMADAGLDSEAE